MSWVAVGVAAVGVLSAYQQSEAAKNASKDANKASDAQIALGHEQLDYLKDQDELKQGLGSEWYDYQRNLAEQEDQRRFDILPQVYDNAQASFDEVMANAGLYYDEATGLAYNASGEIQGNAWDLYGELTGNAQMYGEGALDNAYSFQSDILGNADRTYNELTDNARYSEQDYLDATGAASGDVVQSFDKSRGITRRNAMRYGLNPNSSEFSRMESDSAIDQALAEAGAVNTTRRSMKNEERGRLDSAIRAGLSARADALRYGSGAVDSAIRYSGDINRDAYTQGRGAIDSATRAGAALELSAVGAGRAGMDSAIRYGRGNLSNAMLTNLGTTSSQLGIVDPRIGMVSQTNSGYGTLSNAYAQQAAAASANAASSSANATNAMVSAGSTAGMIAGYNYNRPVTNTTQNNSTSGVAYDPETGMSSYGDNQYA